ncbi:chitinase-3-like protein 1 [Mizuhopecten yessoensis]|uniref:Acidic mammalian chitinase n=1 Tax=Mizuhopecten yessoensis TaxID=6573 RepID=A0A210Q829_MIZYE|nr:chitinase-3-like protein 1 [Mizuhopecten yessoensis]XP_021364781.1 chitinase-3-like protein 1 [Mizuhopecten yessoensis]XP_021364782.1 chitinase-3-like protein 1 [Mizuhopecten yessoensis]OWF44902.1 Acidic mammalian chitinase [Mizuhopecten yessoensis]
MYAASWSLFPLLISTLLGVKGSEFRRVCYHTNWSNHLGNFYVQTIDPYLCTHIIYAFARIDISEKKLARTEVDDDNGMLGDDRSGNYFKFTGLKTQNPKLKTLLSVGGETLSAVFPKVVASHVLRVFAQNCKIFLRDRNFDGLDIDWEFPQSASRDDFTQLLKVMREVFDDETLNEGQSRLILTIATAAGKDNIDTSYNMTEISKYVDFFNVMAYDYAGTWSQIAGFGSPLYSRLSNPLFNPENSQNWTMNHYIALGAPKEKLVMGVRGAGASFTLKDSSKHDVGAPVIVGGGNKGSVRQLKGHLAYYEICFDLINKGATTVWDDEQKSNYAYMEDQWVGYDDTRSVVEKVNYAGNLGLGGVMFWAFDYDDFSGTYCDNGTYPLLTAMKNAAMKYTTEDPSPSSVDITVPALPTLSVTTEKPSINDGTFKLFNVIGHGVVHSSSSLVITTLLSLCMLFCLFH